MVAESSTPALMLAAPDRSSGPLLGEGDTGRFRILDALGEGGCAQVYLAVAQGQAGFNKLVVLKQPKLSFLEQEGGRETFLDEARLAARLNHPNIVQTNEVIVSDVPCMVMEYLEGQPLSSIVTKAGNRLDTLVHLRIIVNALLGLHCAHELTDYDGTPLGLVHRDMSPQNVYVTFDGQVKLLDFGIAKLDASGKTETGVVKGKLRYMAPEQFQGGRVDRRTDIFAAGVMIWEAITRQRMRKNMSDFEVMQGMLNGDMPSPRTVVPEIPDELERICMKALAPNRDDRYSNADELVIELEQYLENTSKAVGNREIRQMMCTVFEAQRQQRKELIERKLREVVALSSREYLAYVSARSTQLFTSTTGSGSVSRSGEVDVVVPTFSGPQPGRGRRAVVFGAVIVGVAFASATAATVFHRSTKAPPAPVAHAGSVPGSTIPTSTASVAAAVPPKRVTVAIVATPPEARIYFDDVVAPANPYLTTLPADRSAHVVRVESAGYAPARIEVVLDGDVNRAIALERLKDDRKYVPSKPARPAAVHTGPGLVDEL